MNRLPVETRASVIASLVEGMGIRPTARVVGVAINSVQAVIRDLGPACRQLHDEKVRGLACKKIEGDEAWGFIYARAKNVPPHKRGDGSGDVWVWTTVDVETKIVPAWHVGRRDRGAAFDLFSMLRRAVPGRFELNTDGLNAYWSALSLWSAETVPDYARIVKSFATPSGQWSDRENRYQQPAIRSITKERICGNPDMARAGTSRVERMNLGLRMSQGKMARLSNKHAKRIEMLDHSMSVYYTHYNLCRPHSAIGGRTPAMANGLTDRCWTCADLIRYADGLTGGSTPN